MLMKKIQDGVQANVPSGIKPVFLLRNGDVIYLIPLVYEQIQLNVGVLSGVKNA